MVFIQDICKLGSSAVSWSNLKPLATFRLRGIVCKEVTSCSKTYSVERVWVLMDVSDKVFARVERFNLV